MVTNFREKLLIVGNFEDMNDRLVKAAKESSARSSSIQHGSLNIFYIFLKEPRKN